MDSAPFPTCGRLAGIDYGTVRIGIAVCDPDWMVASPWQVYTRRGEREDGEFFRALAASERLAGWVVGLPVHMSGDESQKSREARQFGQWLSDQTGLPVRFQDERFTTDEANALLGGAGIKRRKADERRDMLAAQAILARFLQVQSSPGSGSPPD